MNSAGERASSVQICGSEPSLRRTAPVRQVVAKDNEAELLALREHRRYAAGERNSPGAGSVGRACCK